VAGTAAPTTQNASKLVASQGPSNIWDKNKLVLINLLLKLTK